MNQNRCWPGVPNRYRTRSLSSVIRPKSIATVVVDLSGTCDRSRPTPAHGHQGLGGQRRDLRHRTDESGLAHTESARDHDLRRGGLAGGHRACRPRKASFQRRSRRSSAEERSVSVVCTRRYPDVTRSPTRTRATPRGKIQVGRDLRDRRETVSAQLTDPAPHVTGRPVPRQRGLHGLDRGRFDGQVDGGIGTPGRQRVGANQVRLGLRSAPGSPQPVRRVAGLAAMPRRRCPPARPQSPSRNRFGRCRDWVQPAWPVASRRRPASPTKSVCHLDHRLQHLTRPRRTGAAPAAKMCQSLGDGGQLLCVPPGIWSLAATSPGCPPRPGRHATHREPHGRSWTPASPVNCLVRVADRSFLFSVLLSAGVGVGNPTGVARTPRERPLKEARTASGSRRGSSGSRLGCGLESGRPPGRPVRRRRAPAGHREHAPAGRVRRGVGLEGCSPRRQRWPSR